MPEERKLVTVLFADFTGSTAIADAHDPEVVRAALDDAFGQIAEAVRQHGGTVEKFIGDAVMAVFGVPRAHGDDAERAVRAAFAIRAIVASLREPMSLGVRIGVNTGEVVTRGDAGDQRLATGVAVNVAQRLQAAAVPGEILVGELTHRLTATTIKYGSPREIAGKGIRGAVARPAELLLPEDIGRPPAAGTGGAPLVGRDAELRRCREALAAAVSTGRPYLLTVVGAPGIGKSRLALEILSGVDPSMLLRGRCVPYGEAATYPLQQMLRADAGVDHEDTQEETAAKLRRRTAEVVGADEDVTLIARSILVLAGALSTTEAMPGVAEHDVPDELRWAFRRYVERRTPPSGAILVFEDIHWASPLVLDLIEHLADRARVPLLLLCLARPELFETTTGWGATRDNGGMLELGALSRDETAELIRGLLSTAGGVSEPLADAVYARSEGNPLYVEEYVRALTETGGMAIPPTLQGLVAARLDRLPSEVRRVVQIASVIGRTFSSSALGVLCGAPSSAALRTAIQSDVVAEAESWEPGRGAICRFRHALFHEVAYGMLAKADRAQMHDRYREWCESPSVGRRDELVEVVAHHADRAHELAREIRSADAPRLGRIAFDRLRAAAVRARDRGDLRTSLALWSRAREAGAAVDLSEAERIEVDGEALLIRASLRGDDVWHEIEELLPRARSLGPSAVLAHLLIAVGWRTYTFTFDVSRTVRLMDEALETARALGDPELITHAMLQVFVSAASRGDRQEVGRLHEEALAYAKAHGVVREMPTCLRALAQWATRGGSFSRAAELLDEALRLAHASGSKAAEFHAMAMRAEMSAWTDPAGAIAAEGELTGLAETLGTRDANVRALDALGWARFEAGDLDGARRSLERALAMTDPASAPYGFSYTATYLIFALVALGDVVSARRIRAMLEPIDIPWQNQRAMRALVDAALAEAEGDEPRAEELYRRSLAIFEQATTALTWFHGAQERFAGFLLRRNRVGEARELLEDVRRFFADPLAAPRRARVEALLGRSDAVPLLPPAPSAGPGGP